MKMKGSIKELWSTICPDKQFIVLCQNPMARIVSKQQPHVHLFATSGADSRFATTALLSCICFCFAYRVLTADVMSGKNSSSFLCRGASCRAMSFGSFGSYKRGRAPMPELTRWLTNASTSSRSCFMSAVAGVNTEVCTRRNRTYQQKAGGCSSHSTPGVFH